MRGFIATTFFAFFYMLLMTGSNFTVTAFLILWLFNYWWFDYKPMQQEEHEELK